MQTAHDTWLQAPYQTAYTPPRELTESEVIDLDVEQGPLLLSGDEGYYFEILRSSAFPLSEILIAGWFAWESANKHRPEFPREAESLRRLLRACDKANAMFAEAYREKQEEVSQ